MGGSPQLRLHGVVAALGVLVLSLPSAARANGRFPRAERLIEDPRDRNHLVLAATFGLVATTDGGRSWFHICEGAFAESDAYVGDPLVAFAPDGSLVADVQTTLNRSVDQGCSWSAVLGGPTESVPDFTVTPGSRGALLALRLQLVDGSNAVRLHESMDNGATFVPLGAALDVFTAFSVEVAPSDPNTIYVSARSAAGANLLLVSTDGGATFSENALPNTPFDEIPYIAAVHPSDPRKVYIRTDARDMQNGLYLADDALFYSEDAGRTWTELYRTGAKMLGFALSPDASTVLLGYGNPRDPEQQIDDSVTGVYRGAPASTAFQRIIAGSVTCLSWTKTGVYVCRPQTDAGYAVGFSVGADLGADGAGIQPLLQLPRVLGPLCCGGAPQAACVPSWTTSCALLGSCGDGGGVTSVCSNSGSAGGGTAGSSGKGSASSGCGCRAAGRPAGPAGDAGLSADSDALFATLAVWCGVAARRRRRC